MDRGDSEFIEIELGIRCAMEGERGGIRGEYGREVFERSEWMEVDLGIPAGGIGEVREGMEEEREVLGEASGIDESEVGERGGIREEYGREA